MLNHFISTKHNLFQSLWTRFFCPPAIFPETEIETIFSDTADRHITLKTDGSAILWDRQGQAIAHYLPVKQGYIHNAEFILEDDGFTPRTRILLESTTGIFLLNRDGDQLIHLKHHFAPPNGIPTKKSFPFLPTLSAARLTGEQSLWICTFDGKQKRKLGILQNPIVSIEIATDNQSIITVAANGTTTHWNLNPPKHLRHKPCTCQSCTSPNPVNPVLE